VVGARNIEAGSHEATASAIAEATAPVSYVRRQGTKLRSCDQQKPLPAGNPHALQWLATFLFYFWSP
jgi:hypothetical protein